jgi:hypothetical protein
MSNLKDRSDSARPVAWYAPMGGFGSPDFIPYKAGMTVYEIVKSAPNLPAEFIERGVVQINDHEICRGAWHLVRPKPSTREKPIILTLHLAPRGGKKGGGTGKAVIAIVAMIALTVITAGIAAYGIGAGMLAGSGAGIGGFFAAGSVSAKILARAVGIIGSLAISALTRPPAQKEKPQETQQTQESASASGNTIEPNGSIPRVIGTHKIFPPLAGEPLTEFVGQDEFVYAAYVANGPHDIDEIKSGETLISDDDSVEIETREGWESDSPITLIQRQSRTNAPQVELSAHKTQTINGTYLENQISPEKSLPKWHRYATSKSPDEVVLQFLFPGGLYYPADPVTYPLCVPIRMRMRKSGDTSWINLPEVHFRGKSSKALRGQVILHWDATTIPPISEVLMTTDTGAAHVFHRMPIQTVTPADPGTYQWEADSSFYSGAGNAFMTSGSATGMQNVYVDNNERAPDKNSWSPSGVEPATAGKNTVHLFLDSGTFPKGVYEIECMRGVAYANPSFTASSYSYSGAVRNFFKYQSAISTWTTQDNQSLYVSNTALVRIVSIWNEHPIPKPGLAIIAVRARNRRLEQISALMSGYVKDWDGSGWNTWTTTSNPAPHFYDVLTGPLNYDPVLPPQVNNTRILEWRQNCIDNDYTCDLIIDNMRLEEVLNAIASTAYARPRWSDQWSVILDYDRSTESPVQIFTPRNSRGFKFEKALPQIPDGLRVTYRRKDIDYANDQVDVFAADVSLAGDDKIESVNYAGIVYPEKVEARAKFDLKQTQLRSTFYSLEAPVQWIVCERGSLVGIQHDVLVYSSASGSIKAVNTSAGNIISVALDTEIDIPSNYDMTDIPDMLAEDDVMTALRLGVAIRRTDGTTSVHEISNTSGRTATLTFTTPFADDTTTGSPFDSGSIHEVEPGCIVSIGPLTEEYLRMIVMGISPGKDLTARLTLVDEAPELWEA